VKEDAPRSVLQFKGKDTIWVLARGERGTGVFPNCSGGRNREKRVGLPRRKERENFLGRKGKRVSGGFRQVCVPFRREEKKVYTS